MSSSTPQNKKYRYDVVTFIYYWLLDGQAVHCDTPNAVFVTYTLQRETFENWNQNKTLLSAKDWKDKELTISYLQQRVKDQQVIIGSKYVHYWTEINKVTFATTIFDDYRAIPVGA